MEQPTTEAPAEEQAGTPIAPGALEISSAAVMQEARADYEMGFNRRLLLTQQSLVLAAMISERDERINQLGQEITDRDNHSVAVDRDLDTKSARIAELEAHLADRETRIEGLQRDVAAKDTAIRALETQLHQARQATLQNGSN